MLLDSKEQQSLMLEILDKTTFMGTSVEAIFFLKQSIKEAQVTKVEDSSQDSKQQQIIARGPSEGS